MSRRDYDPDQDWDFFPDHIAPTLPEPKLKVIQLKIAERLIGDILPATLGELEQLAEYPNFAYSAIKGFYDDGHVTLKIENEETLLVFAKPTLSTWWSMTLKPSRQKQQSKQQPPPATPPSEVNRKSSTRKSRGEVLEGIEAAIKFKRDNPSATRKQIADAVGLSVNTLKKYWKAVNTTVTRQRPYRASPQSKAGCVDGVVDKHPGNTH